ncbi:MAG: efflux RND transporter periplasmic adaptor subunit [Verrucomicrobiales bacterium]|nr:efflux RND transporter periplasmic adaptor subunit [Verrucomicrobiales bacterium]
MKVALERSRAWSVTVGAIGIAWVVGTAGCKPTGGGGATGGAAGAPVMQVVVETVGRRPVHETLALVGSFTANEQVEIKSESEGFVESIGFTEGQEVSKGTLLVTLDESKLKAGLEEAESSLKLSRQTFERAKELLEAKLISQQEYDQASSRLGADEATVSLRRRQLRDAMVVAPFKGVVGARQVSPGQLVNRATTLTWLVDLDPVKVEFNVPERFLGQVKEGQTIEVGVAAYPEQKFRGKVFFVAPFVDPVTRTVLMKAEVPNADRKLKPGMFANLDLTLQVRADAVVISEAALSQILDGNRATVMLVGPEEVVAPRPVKVGMRLPGAIEIAEGLSGGERVVVQGLQKIAPGMKVRVAPAGPAPETGAPENSTAPAAKAGEGEKKPA